jgi:hypothetical protein
LGAAANLRLLSTLGLGARFGDFDAGAVGKFPHRVAELEALDALHEFDRVARLVTAEAIVEAALGVDVEARRLLFVKRAHANVASAALLQPDGLADQLYDPNLPPDAVEGLLSDHRIHILQIVGGERLAERIVAIFTTCIGID